MRAMVRCRLGTVLTAVCMVTVAFAGMATMPVAAHADAVPFKVRGSILQVETWGHPVGSTVELLDATDTPIKSGTADKLGALLFRDLTPAAGYKVREGGGTSDPVTVTAQDDNPPQSFYTGQAPLSAGYGYITTRDGTKLATNVTLPNPALAGPGPYPVVVEYSGYDPAQPGGAPQEAQIYPYFGYAVVAVNMRGTTCSGGAFWFFEEAQRSDGYDVIETVAQQPWSNGKVGMVGISYSGYSQLYVASTRPPHLKAITPLSPFSDGLGGILFPGGILNNGFALNWALDRQEAAKPAIPPFPNPDPDYGGHQWVKNRINGGDTTCADNQTMRLQSQDLQAEIQRDRFNEPKYSFLDGRSFIPRINVPTYISTQWQDEQTGGYAAEVAEMVKPNAYVRGEFTNGTHVDPLGPEDFLRVTEFIDLYVGEVRPTQQGAVFYRNGIIDGLKGIFGETMTLPPARFGGFADYASAKAFYESEPPIRIRYENGGCPAVKNGACSTAPDAEPGKEGQPYATNMTTFASWPLPNTSAERWYMQPDGQLALTAPTVADTEARASTPYVYDPTTKRKQTFDGSTEAAWRSHPDVHWLPLTEGNSLSFTTPAFASKVNYTGHGSADLWVRSSAADTELEVTLTEVRPDGQEVYIQSGWMRARSRKLDVATSTELRPRHTFTQADSAPMPAGEFVPIRIEIFPFAHIMRPGSKLRVNIEAPGGNQDFWAFDALPGTHVNEIGHSAGMPSSIVLPLPADQRAAFFSPAAAPSCNVAGVTTQSQSLRNQPCREYKPARVPTGVTATPNNGHIQVAWQAPPTWAGGSAPTGYRVTVSPTNDTVDVPAGTTSLDYSNVGTGGTFTFKVAAKFDSVVAPSSDASLAVTIGDPSAPQSVVATAAKESAVVTWAAPASDGGSPITGYTVTATPGGATCAWTTGPLTCTVTGLTAGTSYTFGVTATNASGTGPAGTSAAVTPWSGAGFHPVAPFRILDTRVPGAPFPAVYNGAPGHLTVAGVQSIPASATGVVMNVTATGGTAPSFLTVWPAGDTRPVASNLNFGPGQTIANLVTVPIGAGGKVDIANTAGYTDVVADVVGYFDDGTGPGDLFTGIDPTRVLDSRTALGGWGSTRLAAGGTKDLVVTGSNVPVTATAVVANVTATDSTAGSYLRAWPAGEAEPTEGSIVNFAKGETIPNLATVKVGAGGKITFRNNTGATHVTVDIVGYFDASTGSRFHPLKPVRFLDSRDGTGTSGGAWGAEARAVTVAHGVPADATAVIANTTATQGTANSFLRVFPTGGSEANNSNVNFAVGQTIPNLVMSKLGTGGALSIRNVLGNVHVIGDAQGYYAQY
jgi:predicted acyl esterase